MDSPTSKHSSSGSTSPPRAPFCSPAFRSPTPPPAPVPVLEMPMTISSIAQKIHRPVDGWLRSSADPDVSVCEMCGEFQKNIILEENYGCCSIHCLVQKGIEAKQKHSPPSPQNDRSKPALERQTTRSPAYEAEQEEKQTKQKEKTE